MRKFIFSMLFYNFITTGSINEKLYIIAGTEDNNYNLDNTSMYSLNAALKEDSAILVSEQILCKLFQAFKSECKKECFNIKIDDQLSVDIRLKNFQGYLIEELVDGLKYYVTGSVDIGKLRINIGHKTMPYYLLIPKNKISLYENYFNLNNLKKVECDELYECSDFCNRKISYTETMDLKLLQNLFKNTKQSPYVLNIMLFGHGKSLIPSKRKKILKMLENKNNLEEELGLTLDNLNNDELKDLEKKINLTKYNIPKNLESKFKDYIQLQINIRVEIDTNLNSALIGNIKINVFRDILNFFNLNLNLDNLMILSCYSGGLNSIVGFTDPKINLVETKYDFNIITTSTSEDSVSINPVNIIPEFIIFNDLINGNQKNNADLYFSKKSESMATNGTIVSLPMIRKKNTNHWEPLFTPEDVSSVNLYIIDKKFIEQNKNKLVDTKTPSLKQGIPAIIYFMEPCIPIKLKVLLFTLRTWLKFSTIGSKSLNKLYIEELETNSTYFTVPTYEEVFMIIRGFLFTNINFDYSLDPFPYTLLIKKFKALERVLNKVKCKKINNDLVVYFEDNNKNQYKMYEDKGLLFGLLRSSGIKIVKENYKWQPELFCKQDEI